MPVIIDGTSGITTPAVDTTTAITASDGGTGQTSLTAGSVLVGNGTSAVNLVAAGSNGNVLTSDGTTWTSAAAAGGQLQTELFTAPGTWTKPASCTQVKVTVVGGGAGGLPAAAPVFANPGGTTSFGPALSATGGTASPTIAGQFPGNGTVSVGTAIKTGAIQMNTSGTPTTADGISGRLTSLGGGIAGALNRGNILSPAAISYATSIIQIAGGNGNNGGYGGLAVAIVPVSAPVTVTVGAGGAGGNAGTAQQVGTGGVGGAVLVEFVG
jgi:hypothetical protein